MHPHAEDRTEWNRSRCRPGDQLGFYESYFQRANHPERPLAFWIRYTAYSPARRPESALGELWAIYFDGEAGRITAAKQAFALSVCSFSAQGLDVRVGPATLRDGHLAGHAASGGHEVSWSLAYTGADPPLLLLPRRMYAGGFPRAKAVVGTPHAVFSGSLTVDGQSVAVEGWAGSQNHNWGARHTDRYAWGQVSGFDGVPRAFLECSTARVRLGPFWTPWLTLIVLRLDDEEFALNSLLRSVRAHGRFRIPAGPQLRASWELDSSTADLHVSVHIDAPASSFVGLRYANPPGGFKTCLNTKLARCELRVERRGRPALDLVAAYRAAFEILTDAAVPGIPVVA